MSKSAINISESIAANSKSNVLRGSRFENIPRTGFILLAQTGSAAGLEAELFIGTRNAVELSPVGSQNRTPQVPDDVVVDEVDAFAGEKAQLNVTNTTGAALTYQARLILDDNVESF